MTGAVEWALDMTGAVEWALDPGCPVVAGFAVPHATHVYQSSHKQCGWRPRAERVRFDGPPFFGWRYTGFGYECFHVEGCSRRGCGHSEAITPRQCPEYRKRPRWVIWVENAPK